MRGIAGSPNGGGQLGVDLAVSRFNSAAVQEWSSVIPATVMSATGLTLTSRMAGVVTEGVRLMSPEAVA